MHGLGGVCVGVVFLGGNVCTDGVDGGGIVTECLWVLQNLHLML